MKNLKTLLLPTLLTTALTITSCGQTNVPAANSTQAQQTINRDQLVNQSRNIGVNADAVNWVSTQSDAWIREHAPATPKLSSQMAEMEMAAEDCGLPFVVVMRYVYRICYTDWPYYYVKYVGKLW